MIIINFLFIVFCIILIITKKKISNISGTLLFIGITMFILQIVNFSSQIRKIDLPSEFFEDIREIKWEDTENLEQIGFYDYDNYHTIFSADQKSMYSIIVKKNSEVPENLSTKNNISYDIYETRPGILSFQRLVHSECLITRTYRIYINGIEIIVSEDNVEHSEPLFPELLKSLIKKQKKTWNGSQ